MGASGDGPRASEVGKEMKGRGLGGNGDQRGGDPGGCRSRVARAGRIRAWEPQPTGHGTVMLLEVVSREATAVRLVAPVGVGAGSG